MICSFSQTYSDERNTLFQYHEYDSHDIMFRNKLKKSYYAFHNCTQNNKEKLLKSKYFTEQNNLQEINYENMTYPQTFYETLQYLKSEKVNYICFLQDDVYCMTNKNILDELLKFIHKGNFNMLNLEVQGYELEPQKKCIYQCNNFCVYNTTSQDFQNTKGFWSFDDGPYIAKIDYLLNNIYDDEYFSKENIWDAEAYINEKIKKHPIERFTTNHTIFKRCNIIGPNANNMNYEIENLRNILKIQN